MTLSSRLFDFGTSLLCGGIHRVDDDAGDDERHREASRPWNPHVVNHLLV
jgi:hypothetical protein